MKKSFSVLLLALFCLGLTSCDHSQSDGELESLAQGQDFEKLRADLYQSFPDKNATATTRTTHGCMDLSDCIWTFVDTSIVRDIQITPDCKARVHYDLYFCELGPDITNLTLQFNIDNFEAYPIAGECDSIVQSWINLYSTGDTVTLEQDVRDFNYKVGEILEQLIIEEFLFDDHWAPWFPCKSENTLLYAEFSLVECSQLWLKFIVSEGDPIWFRPIFADCGDMCCRRRTLYCVDGNGQIHESNQVFTQLGDCDTNPTPPGDEYFPIGDCLASECSND